MGGSRLDARARWYCCFGLILSAILYLLRFYYATNVRSSIVDTLLPGRIVGSPSSS